MTCWGDDEPDPPSDRPKVRGCTDVFWLAIYVSFWFLMIMIAGFALAYGNPRRLVNGYDSFGNTCGAEYNEKIGNFSLTGLNMTNKKFLFFFNMANVRQSMDICVEKCPDRDLLTLDDLRSFYKETGSKLCRYDFDILGENKDPHGLNESLLVSSAYGPCPLLPVNKSTPVMNRCVPTTIVEPVKNIVHGVFDLLNSWDFVEQVLGDLYATWHYILAMTFLALFLSLIVISLFYLFANIVSFIIMTVVCIASLVGCTTVWWTYYEIKVELDNTPSELLLEEAIQNERVFFIYGIISSVITAVILLLVCSMRRNLNFLADLFKEAAECLSALPSLYFQPILSFMQLLVFYWFWVLVVVCLATANYPGVKSVHPFSSDASPSLLATSPGHRLSPSDQDSILGLHPVSNISIARHKTFTLVQYADATWVRYMWWVYLISLVWTSEFILSCQQMVVAGAVARWYFNGWKKTTKSPVLTSFRHMICYHLGTMAKGSLLITIFKLPRLILTYLHTKFKKSEEVSSCARCSLKSCICCFWCLENFIRYINHNAYTVVAMQGINFCPAAARAFHVLMSNAIQFAIINSMGDFILFLGKVIVTAITGSVGLLLIKSNEHLYFYSAPTLVICVFAYFIAHSVISLYEIVIDTLFLCVCEDQNMNGEGGRWRERTLSSIRSTNGSSNSRMVPELKPMNA